MTLKYRKFIAFQYDESLINCRSIQLTSTNIVSSVELCLGLAVSEYCYSCVLAGRMEIIYDKGNNFSLTTGACLIRGFEIDISWRYTCVIVSNSINVIHTD